ncbi:MAG: phage Gp37/Gp68 family protein [Anaerolineae bacterium]
MASRTSISWTDATWNPWRGCHKVSQGCKSCYMFREQKRYGRDPNVVVRSKTTFYSPLGWKEPRKVFTCSWSDFFIAEADEWRSEAWSIIRRTPHLTYQILTKRPENIAARLPADWGEGYANCWLGVSVEDQSAAEERIPFLLKTPAAVRFLSCEPLLGPVRLDQCASVYGIGQYYNALEQGIDWVIVGGESGPHARPMHPGWARSIRDQCVGAGASFFFKQWGNWTTDLGGYTDYALDVVKRENNRRNFHAFPDGLVMRRINSKQEQAAMLDEVEWHQFP